MIRKFTILFSVAAILFCSHLSAQNLAGYTSDPVDPAVVKPLPNYRGVIGDSSVLAKNKMQQQTMFREGNYPYPPKPKNMWEIGVNAGTFFVSGDVKAQLGWGFGATVRKSVGYTLSLRAQYLHGVATGLNWEPSGGLKNNPVFNGHSADTNLNYLRKPGYVYHNYKMKNTEFNLGAVFTLNNIGYHRKSIDRKINLYGIVSVGGQWYKTWYNALNADGKSYAANYASILAAESHGGITRSDRDQTLSDLHNVLDDTYETLAEGHKDEERGFGDKVFNPCVNGGFAIAFHISKRLSLQLEEKATFTQDDLLDGQRWQEHPFSDPSLTRDFDVYHYESVALNFSIGKHVEPLWWINPNDYTYDNLQALIKKNADELIDTDDDGVIDKFDKEPNTPAGYRVDTHGVTMDCDKDGIPDNLDSTPCGEPGDAYVKKTDMPGYLAGFANLCNVTAFPSVNFDLDKYYIKPEYFAAIHEIALAMIACPDKKMVATGHTDNRESNDYNMVLSWERVNKVVDYIVAKYGISRDRFIIKYEGESHPLIPGLPDYSWSPVYEPRQYQNRRVEFHWGGAGEAPGNNSKPKGPKTAGEDY